jgi:predicted DNA-binding transcriptional regulator AlpA
MKKRQHRTKVRHHLDRRADKIASVAGVGADDDLLTTRQVANWLGMSEQWVEIGRVKNFGPKFTRLGPRTIRYRRGDVLAWLNSRTHDSTAEYAA